MSEYPVIADIFAKLGVVASASETAGLVVTAPADGSLIATIAEDTQASVAAKVMLASGAQKRWGATSRAVRGQWIEKLAEAIKQQREPLAQLIVWEAGKTIKEALTEVDGSSDVLSKTIKDATLADFSNMRRTKERPPAGVVGLITSFNFPVVVAGWTIAPALLAGNGVLWKPSEKTPLSALAYKAIFDQVMGEYADLLQIIIGGREIGTALVAHEHVDMISATGSVAMGQGIKATLANKKNNHIKPVLELGGNNGVIVSQHFAPERLEWLVQSIMNSYLGTSGQRCTNTRRIIVHKSQHDPLVAVFEKKIQDFLALGIVKNPLTGLSNDYGFGPLIDADGFARFEDAKKHVLSEGGKIVFGKRLHASQFPQAYYVEPTLALLPRQTSVMYEETFAPILFVTPYDGDITQAIAILNAPSNAGLVSGIYTQSQKEADYFAAHSQAGHVLINSAKGTGTPAFGMGFGGNKDSGEGEILNNADPLRAFTRDTAYSRIAQNTEIPMDKD